MKDEAGMCDCGRPGVDKVNWGWRCEVCKKLESTESAKWIHNDVHGRNGIGRKAAALRRLYVEPYAVRLP